MRTIDIGERARPDTLDPGPAPMLQWIRIDHLVVDDSYQRELKQGNWKAIVRIAKNFRWSRFSSVFVAPVEGGQFAIIDGQHRTHAAAICGFAEVPCQIVHMTREEQAASFAAVNGMVTKVSVWQIYKAALTAGESWAVQLASIAEDAGCRVMTSNTSHWTKKPGEIYGVSSFRSVVETRSRASLIDALKLLMSAEGYNDAAEIWDTSVLCPILRALSDRAFVLDNPRFKDEFELFDIWGLIDAIHEDNKNRIRKGLPFSPKREQLENRLIDWIDRKFPDRARAAS